MVREYILFQDEFHPAGAAVLNAENRAFRYGDGLFETMRMMKGVLAFPDEHADRLQAGMKALKMEGGTLLDGYFLKQKAAELTKKNRHTNARLRLSVFRDGDGLYTPATNRCGYLLQSWAVPHAQYEFNRKGLIVDVYDELTKPAGPLANFKTANALLYVMAGIYRKTHQLDDAFILNQDGFLCESLSANVFVVYNKQLYTPALSEGCIAGVMRREVMRLAKVHDIPLVEAQINPEILNEAEEVFVTNAASGISWVMGYGRKRYFNEMSRFLSQKLNEPLL
ncbi:4-amino-4-deoxychorismate lyase [Pedobacter yulinensis]|uniref:branched-chain-amino-acid transaminase n=1 Tax=Pedobacter yulinensis TaxID=2126353 RepID=A0A2T3HIE3_9SPHI|nr:aminotransferase class IV [Pedobacter yulinensis]PST82202.1 4-amino-4-deoxychorismate lyase [Pedobacter yulinensis]